MIRKQRGSIATRTESAGAGPKGPCAICGMSDARGLVEVDLAGEPCITLCGSHELMHRRSGFRAATVAELRMAFDDRRSTERRGGPGEIDELAEKLSAAFMRDRRGPNRRAS